MATKLCMLFFNEDVMREPVLYQAAARHRVTPNIQRAEIDEVGGRMDVALDGSPDDIEDCVAELERRGVKVEPIED